MLLAAKARGLRVLAITDHAENTLPGVGREALLEQRTAIRAAQAALGDSLTLLHGVELNIGPNGELDYDDEFRASFDCAWRPCTIISIWIARSRRRVS